MQRNRLQSDAHTITDFERGLDGVCFVVKVPGRLRAAQGALQRGA